MNRFALSVFFVLLLTGAAGCVSSLPTSHIPPIGGFELERYLGQWYEIARLPHSFEKGLSRVRAEYVMAEDNSYVVVVNRGYDAEAGKWREARGRAVMKGADDAGILEVTFFRPFWGDYKIIILDRKYQYAVVTGSSMDYLWILARAPRMDAKLRQSLIGKARSWGFDTDKLILVEQQ